MTALGDAARWGHRDAQLLLTAPRAQQLPGGSKLRSERGELEDPEFARDVGEALAIVRHPGLCGTDAVTSVGAGQPLPHVPAGPPSVPPGPAGATTGPVFVAGISQLWSPAPLRAAPLRGLAQQVSPEPHSPDQWQSALRVLDVLDIISGASRPVSAEHLAQRTSRSRPVLAQLLRWLCEQGLTTALDDGSYLPGPVLRLMSAPGSTHAEHVLRHALVGLRDTVGAAVYVSSYTDGEVTISQYADGPTAPKVHEWVDFRAAADASAVGKSLLAQLDFDSRMDHLSRRQPVRLTARTITNHHALFHALDAHGPQAAQFDLLEYSTQEVCVAIPLTVAGQVGCVALSLPAAQRHRLVDAARTLSNRSAGLLLSLLLARPSPAEAASAGPSDGRPPGSSVGATPPPGPAPASCGPLSGQSAGPATPMLAAAVALPLLGLHLPPSISTPVPRIRHLVSNSPCGRGVNS
ncbi:hypothetical protein CG740_34845 [Streptomyces sp. CB01201]|nr:hypothetical protein CG740_34845 [Streptomyces sp. CB01201]